MSDQENRGQNFQGDPKTHQKMKYWSWKLLLSQIIAWKQNGYLVGDWPALYGDRGLSVPVCTPQRAPDLLLHHLAASGLSVVRQDTVWCQGTGGFGSSVHPHEVWKLAVGHFEGRKFPSPKTGNDQWTIPNSNVYHTSVNI